MRTALSQATLGVLSTILTACGAEAPGDNSRHHVPIPALTPTDQPCEPGSIPADVRLFPDRIDLAPGHTAAVEVHVTRNGYCGPIEVIVGELSPGVDVESDTVQWPETVAKAVLTASHDLSDEIRHVPVHVSTSQENTLQFKLRTRGAELDWTAEVVGIPDSRGMGDSIWIDDGRFIFSELRRTAIDEMTPIVRCIEPGIGPCSDFGDGGAISLERHSLGPGSTQIARDPTGLIVVATAISEPNPSTTWGRLTPDGEWLSLPAMAPVATDVIVHDVAVDATGRILFLSKVAPLWGPTTLARLQPDGSLDEAFGDGGLVSATGINRIHLAADGRIILDGSLGFAWLDESGIPSGPPLSFEESHFAAEAFPDGRMIYGQLTHEGEPNEKGSVAIVDAAGSVTSGWELGLGVRPIAFLLDRSDPVVIADVDGQGRLQLIRLPANEAATTIADHKIGSSVQSATGTDVGSPEIVGGREFRLPDGGVGWDEVFVWQAD